MSKFSTTTKKIRILWSRIFINDRNINKNIIDSDEQIQKIDNVNTLKAEYQVPFDYSSDWITPTAVLHDDEGTLVGSIVNWRIEIGNINPDLIHAIKPVIIRRYGNAGDDTNGELKESTSLVENIVISIDPNTIDYLYPIYYLDAAVTLEDNSGLQGDIQFKLLLYLQKHDLYI